MGGIKYIKGLVCTVDPKNIHRQDVRGVHLVSLKNKVKRRPFGNSLWEVDVIDGDITSNKAVFVQERYLYPENMCILRYPLIPPITDADITLLNSLSENNNKVKALVDKLKFYKELKEV